MKFDPDDIPTKKNTGRTRRLCFFPWNFGASPISLVDSERPNPPPGPAGRLTQTIHDGMLPKSGDGWPVDGFYLKKNIYIYPY